MVCALLGDTGTIVRAMLDTGCQVPLVSLRLVLRCGLTLTPISTEVLINGIAENQLRATLVTNITLRHPKTGHDLLQLTAIVVPGSENGWSFKYPRNVPQWLRTQGLELADPMVPHKTEASYDLLLSGAERVQITTGKSAYKRGPFELLQTKLGLMPTGRWDRTSQKTTAPRELRQYVTVANTLVEQLAAQASTTDDNLNELIALYEKQERTAIFGQDESDTSSEQIWLHEFYKTIRQTATGRVVVPIPKRAGFPPSNYSPNTATSKIRLKSVYRILEKQDRFADAYKAIVDDWVKKGILSETSEEELKRKGVHYIELPHHAVIRKESVSTPVRVVIAGNAADTGMASANDHFDPGPNLLPKLVQVLIRWRAHGHFVVGDVSKAFLQVLLHEDDQHRLIFRWPVYENGKWVEKLYRFVHLIWGVNSSPFILNAAIRYLLNKRAAEDPAIAKELRLIEENCYVDDLLFVAKTKQLAVRLATIAIDTLRGGEMVLTKFRSYPPTTTLDIAEEPTTKPYKILGVAYDPQGDLITLDVANLHEFDGRQRLTRRQAASLAARLFDPLGVVCPIIFQAKKLKQKTVDSKKNLSWNALLSKEESQQWHRLMKDLGQVKDTKVPRIAVPDDGEYTLHAFSDASGVGLGVAVYAVSAAGRSILVLGRSKIIPEKEQKLVEKQTARRSTAKKINRLELTAAKFAVETVQIICNALHKKCDEVETHYWTDSQVTVQWLRKAGEMTCEYVTNRVSFILEHSKLENWHHVTSGDNPADHASRGLTFEQFEKSNWLHGPAWLADHDQWPKGPLVLASNAATITKKISLGHVADLFEQLFANKTVPCMNAAIRRYTTFIRVQRIWKERAKQIRNKRRYSKRRAAKKEETTFDIPRKDYYDGEVQWYRDVQYLYANELFKELQTDPGMRTAEGLQWDPELRLIVKVPLGATGLGLQRNLIYIPDKAVHKPDERNKTNPAAWVVARDSHLQAGHAGVEHALSIMRRKYYLPRARRHLQGARSHCYRCTQRHGKPIRLPVGDLPPFRFEGVQPFQTVGVDWLGPFGHVEQFKSQFYVCVMVCPLTRAVMLEPSMSCTTEAFIGAYETAMNRRELQPMRIVSDKAFQTAWREFRKNRGLDPDSEVRKVEWFLTPSKSPWWGGFYERFMKMIKDKLNSMFVRSSFKLFNQMTAAIALVERIINSRPLTFVSNDEYHGFALTPSMFLNVAAEDAKPVPLAVPLNPELVLPLEQERIASVITSRRKFMRNVWALFYDGYIALLKRNAANTTKESRTLHEGQVVLFKKHEAFKSEPSRGKKEWTLARIQKLYLGNDGLPRVADIEVPRGKKKHGTKVLQRQEVRFVVPFEADLFRDQKQIRKNEVQTTRDFTEPSNGESNIKSDEQSK